MQIKIKIQLFIFLLSFLSFKVFPQEINITGKVLDKSSNPMFGVIATLKNCGLADTTGSDGIYLLYKSNTSIGLLQNDYYLKPKTNGQMLMFSVKNRNQKVLVIK